MKRRTIRKSIEINAEAGKIWQTLVRKESIKIWYEAFGKGIVAKTDWQVGSKALFVDEHQCGIVGKITANKPGEMLSIVYQGIVQDGREDYQSEQANNVKGSVEAYRISCSDGKRLLFVQCDMEESYFGYMSNAWDVALEKIKVLSEN
jgi:hypothetical protein